jgi:hypothetical protein
MREWVQQTQGTLAGKMSGGYQSGYAAWDRAVRGVALSNQEAVNHGNRFHYDQLNGADGAYGPSQLQARYPHTQFVFARRGQAGADVTVVPGTIHPSDQTVHPGSTWKSGNMYGDFKPDTRSGRATFQRDVQSQKLETNTQMLLYDVNSLTLN